MVELPLVDALQARIAKPMALVLLILLAAVSGVFYAAFAPTQGSSSSTSTSSSAAVPNANDCYFQPKLLPGSNQAICSDPASNPATYDGRFFDNGIYIGHDEPSVQFFSTMPGSGSNVEWQVTLPSADPVPTQNGTRVADMELFRTIWFSMALCDPWSYPGNPCTPNSDSNLGGPFPASPGAAGSASLEFQLFPPYSGFCPTQNTQWCARTSITSLEATYNYATINTNCESPYNTAYIQTDGVPTGPPGPGSPTPSPNSKTLFMKAGDKLLVIIRDTPAGLYNGIDDITTGQSGYIVASASNGFAHTNMSTCATTPFSFHPEFNTASPTSLSSWTEDADNINMAYEIGHWELGVGGDGDADDGGCGQLWTVSGCLADRSGGTNYDTDFDSIAYTSSWPDGASTHPAAFVIGSPAGNGIGPLSFVNGSGYVAPYPLMQFSTQINDANPACHFTTEAGCTIPPGAAAFYPFYSIAGSGPSCVMNFGNDIPGVTINDFGKDSEYGSPTGGLFRGAKISNPCLPSAPVSTSSTVVTTTTSSTATTTTTTSATTTTTSAITTTPIPTTSSSSTTSTTATTTTTTSATTTTPIPTTSTSSLSSTTTVRSSSATSPSTSVANTTTAVATATSATSSSSTTPEFPYPSLALLISLTVATVVYVMKKDKSS